MYNSFLIAFIFIASISSTAQEDESIMLIQEYEAIVNSDAHDTVKVNALWQWDNLVYFSDPKQDSIILENIIDICSIQVHQTKNHSEKVFFAKNLAQSLNYLGSTFTGMGAYDKAIEKHLEATPIYIQLGQVNGLDGNYINLGIAYYDNGEIEKAVKYYQLGLEATDKSGNIRYRANALLSLANSYLDQKDIEKSLDYYRKALKINLENEFTASTANVYMNMGNALMFKEDLDSAQLCYHVALKIQRDMEDEYSLGTTLHNIGELKLEQNQIDSALIYLTEGMQFREKLNQQSELIYSYSGLSDWSRINGKFNKAIQWGEKAYNLSLRMNSNVHMLPAVQSLFKAYESAGKYKKALEMNLILTNVQDSIGSVDNQKALMSRELAYAYEKTKIADSLAYEQKEALNDLAHKNELEKDAQERYILYGGLVSVLLLGGFAYRGYRRKTADNIIISDQKYKAELQKEQIEEAHKEITDSIAYAKRIQSAILPPEKMIKEMLADSFVYYKPKDIVAGDFYWMEKVGNKVLFAAADCTGHGVPGAMVSVICNGALNRSVREFGLKEPAKILDKAREIVIQEFEKSEEEVKDGMDIALCCIEGNKLQYSGANNPLWIIRGDEIIETKADKQPIGKFEAANPFTNHSVELMKGDTIYIFSDGYVDQFGGDKGKKFKAKALRNLMLSIQELPMKDQMLKLDETFENWRGSLEQIDDVCIIGVNFNDTYEQ